MNDCRGDVVGGFNSFVKDQNPESRITLIQFDHEYTVSYSDVSVSDISPLTFETYSPRGSTSLLDAIGKMLKQTKGPRIVVIFTDGLENSSKIYTKAHIKDLIDERQRKGWTFIYMGANQDSFSEAGSIGIQSAFNYDVAHTVDAFAALSATVSQC